MKDEVMFVNDKSNSVGRSETVVFLHNIENTDIYPVLMF